MKTLTFESVQRTIFHPPGCSCTDCLTGYSEPMTEDEFEMVGYESRIVRETRTTTTYMSIAEAIS